MVTPAGCQLASGAGQTAERGPALGGRVSRRETATTRRRVGITTASSRATLRVGADAANVTGRTRELQMARSDPWRSSTTPALPFVRSAGMRRDCTSGSERSRAAWVSASRSPWPWCSRTTRIAGVPPEWEDVDDGRIPEGMLAQPRKANRVGRGTPMGDRTNCCLLVGVPRSNRIAEDEEGEVT